MSDTQSQPVATDHRTVLIIGISRGIGRGLAASISDAAGPSSAPCALRSLPRASRQGSISLNDRGSYEVYRASKAALNQLMRSYAARHGGEARTLLLIAPGWVQTELGGPGAPQTVEQAVPGIIDTIDAHRAAGGLRFLNPQNEVIPW